MSASNIASIAGTAACVVAGAIAGQSVHKVPEGHHVVVQPHAELAGHLPTSVLPPGWHLCPRLPGLHQAVLVPTEPSEHSVAAHADSRDCYRIAMSSKLVVAPDVGQLGNDSSCALGGPQLVERAVEAVGRRALTELAARCTAPELAAPEPPLRFQIVAATVNLRSQTRALSPPSSLLAVALALAVALVLAVALALTLAGVPPESEPEL